RIEETSPSAPSAVWMRDTPSLALRLVCSSDLRLARNCSEIARPAASSPARLIRIPDASFVMLPDKLSLLWLSAVFAWMDATLVLSEIPIVVLLHCTGGAGSSPSWRGRFPR